MPLRTYARVLRDRWRIVAASFVVVTAGVAAGSLMTEPSYRATGTIEIRKQASEVVPMDALFQQERISDQYLQTEYSTLRSRRLVELTLADPVLAGRLRAALVGATGEAPAETPRPDNIVDRARKFVTVDPVAGSRIIRVSFESPDPQLSADMVNALIAQYRSMREQAGAAALARLGEQADSVRADLLEAERQLQQFVDENGLGAIVLSGLEGETVPQERLRNLQKELTAAETESYRAAVLPSGTDARASATALESELLNRLRARIAELEGEYARLRPTFTDSFPRMRQLRSELAQLDSIAAAEQQRVRLANTAQHDATLRRRQLLEAAVSEQQRLMEAFSAKVAEYGRRRQDVEGQQQLYTALQAKRKEATLSASLASMDVAVLDAATPSRSPDRPRPTRDILFGSITGLLLGIGLAFLREHLDSTLKTPEDASEFEGGPLLAMIPSVPPAIRGGRSTISSGGAPVDLQLAEAFRGLRTSVLYGTNGPLPRTLLVSSSVPAEGKTTVSTNLAISLAMLGRRVLLVDADMRRPSLHRVFGVARRSGLANHLAGTVRWQPLVHRELRPGLDLLGSGTAAGNPSDLLSSPAIHTFLTEAAAAYDFVILDAPALSINVPDARILAHAVNGVLLVVRSGYTSREVVGRLVAQTPHVIGIVLNQLSPRRLAAYYSDYTDTRPVAPAENGSRGSTAEPAEPAIAVATAATDSQSDGDGQ